MTPAARPSFQTRLCPMILAMLGPALPVFADWAGDLLVQSQQPGSISYRIREYALDGATLQTINPPAAPGSTDLQNPRDMVIGQDGQLSLFNGTFDPYLSTYDATLMSWSHITRADWATINNVSYGGIARSGDRVFVTDMLEGSPAGGVVVFNLADASSSEFATHLLPTDLNLGLDGKLWVLSGGAAHAFDPATLAPLGSVTLSGGYDVRGLAVDSNGDFFLATWDGVLAHLGPTGAVIATRSFGGSLTDIDISADGKIAVGTRLDGAWLTDTGLSEPFHIETGRWNSFVAFIPKAPACIVDLNGDGIVDFADYLEFLNLYDAGDLRVDLNGDGIVDFADYLEFLNLFDAGC